MIILNSYEVFPSSQTSSVASFSLKEGSKNTNKQPNCRSFFRNDSRLPQRDLSTRFHNIQNHFESSQWMETTCENGGRKGHTRITTTKPIIPMTYSHVHKGGKAIRSRAELQMELVSDNRSAFMDLLSWSIACIKGRPVFDNVLPWL